MTDDDDFTDDEIRQIEKSREQLKNGEYRTFTIEEYLKYLEEDDLDESGCE